MANLDLGNLIAHLKLNNEQFKREYRGTITSIKKMTDGFRTMGHVARTAYRGMASGLKLFMAPLKTVIKLTLTLKAATAALAAASLGAAAKYEMFRQQLYTVIATKKEADQAFAESILFSVRTPFTPEEIIQTRVELESVGVKGAAAVESVASAAAAMSREIRDVAAAVKSMETEPLRRLGIQLRKQGDEFLFQFRDKMGVAHELAVTGFSQAQEALLAIFGTKFEGGLERMSITFTGLISTLRGAATDLRAAFGTGFLEPAKLILRDIIELIGSMRTDAEAWGKTLGVSLLHARNILVAGFDVALKMAKQITQVLGTEGGIGQIIVGAFNLGASVVGRAIIEAFKVSLELWKTIGTVIGQGVLNALYQSSFPGADLARGIAIKKNLSGMSASDLRKLATSLGMRVQTVQPRFDSRQEVPPGVKIGEMFRPANSAELAAQIASQLAGRSVAEQMKYAEVDQGQIIADSIQKAKDQMKTSMVEVSTTTLKALQDVENLLAEKSGTEAFDVAEEFQKAFNARKEEGAKIMAEWNAQLEMQNQLMQSGEPLQEGANEAAEQQNATISSSNEELKKLLEGYKKLGTEGKFAFSSIEEHLNQTADDIRALNLIGIHAFDTMTDALTEFALKGKANFKDFANAVIADIVRIGVRLTTSRVLLSVFPGLAIPTSTPSTGVLPNGTYRAHAKGGIINSPRIFPMQHGALGLAGEAGAEAVMPVARTPSGDLGVKTTGGSPTFNFHYEGLPLEITRQQEYMASDRRIVDVWLRARDTDPRVRRASRHG